MRRHEQGPTRGVFRRVVIAAGLLLGGAVCAASQTARPMAVMQTRYEVRMGEPTEVPVAADTRDFVIHAKTRRVTMDGQDVAGLVVAPNETQDEILLAANSRATPGNYAVTISATSASGEEMSAEVDVVVKPRQSVPTVPKSSTRAPVVLLNGWISGYSGTCSIASSSSVTFGNLAQFLIQDGVPVVYFFDNCLEGANQSIETLGGDLSSFLSQIKYDDGSQVTQIDVVAHSIGGLIVRAYLEGLQPNQLYQPPYSPLIHNLVMIAVPNFGSFVVGNNSTIFPVGSQGAELIPGSALLWNLATWNQRGDDLAGVNAIAIVGDAGSYATLASATALLSASDGLVSTTSASLMFVNQTAANTRIIPYCHIDPGAFTTSFLGTFACNAPGIARVISASHPTSVIVRSFLAGTTDWKSVGTAPTSDIYLKTNGGAFFALQNAQATFANDLSTVTWGNVLLANGGNFGTIYYTDFATGSGTYAAVSASNGTVYCGPFPVTPGSFSATRCKINLAIACPASSSSSTACSAPAVTPVTGPGRALTAGSTIKLTGVAFGSQCSSCKVYATPAGATSPTTLAVTSWTNTAISVQLPSFPDGYQTLQVNGVAGVDSIGVRVLAAPSAPALSLGSTSLNFTYTMGGNLPAAQPLTISNSGSGTLTWTASVNSTATWLSLDSLSGTAPSTVNVSVNPATLSAGTYTGTITITGAGAENSPATVTATLVVTPAAASLVLNPTSLDFSYTSGGTLPAPQNLTINNGGGGSFTWVASSSDDWVALSAASGSLPGTLNVSLTPQNLGAGNHTATITVATADGSVAPVPVTVTLAVTGNPPAPVITAVANAGGYQTNFASATWVAIFGTNLSQIPYTWQGVDIVNGALPKSLQGVSVTINGIPAYISYISPTQINVLAPDDPTIGPVPVVVTTGQASNPFTAQKVQFSPAFLTLDNKHLAAQHMDYSLLGPPGILPGGPFTPAAPGENIILYAVGLGPTNPAEPTGQTVPGGEPLVNAVTMTIGGIAVTPSFVGLSAPGLYQFNVQVPQGLASGDTTVSATIGDITTQTGVVLTVQ